MQIAFPFSETDVHRARGIERSEVTRTVAAPRRRPRSLPALGIGILILSFALPASADDSAWHMQTMTDKLTDQSADFPAATLEDGDYNVEAKAICDETGISIIVTSFKGEAGIPYTWSGTTADVQARIDDDPIQYASGANAGYTNSAQIFFPELASARSALKQATPFQGDGAGAHIFGALMGGIENYALEQRVGTLEELASAGRVRVQLSFADGSTPVMDLLPGDRVLHAYVDDCLKKLTGGSSAQHVDPPGKEAHNPSSSDEGDCPIFNGEKQC